MNLLTIEIIIHYWTRGNDYRDGDLSAPAVKESINFLLEEDMIRRNDGSHYKSMKYIPTDRLQAFVFHLQELPLPEKKWSMPNHLDDSSRTAKT